MNQTALISYLSHMDVAIIAGNYEGAAAGHGYNRGTLVNDINAGDGVVSPVVMQYNTCDRIGAPGGSGLGAPSSTTTPIWWRQFDAMVSPWSVWESGDSGTHVSSGYYRGNAYAWLTNPCDLGARSKDANGNAMYAAFAKYVHDYYFAGSTADAAPNLGGFYIDNFATPVGSPVGDYLQDGSPAASDRHIGLPVPRRGARGGGAVLACQRPRQTLLRQHRLDRFTYRTIPAFGSSSARTA